MGTFVAISLIWLVSASDAGQIPTVLEQTRQAGSYIHNYKLEYKMDIKERAEFFDENGRQSKLDNYLEFQRVGKTAYDRGKFMFEGSQPKIWEGRLLEGQRKYAKGAYDGARLITNLKPGAYHIQSEGIMMSPERTIFNLFEDLILFIPTLEQKIADGETTVQERMDGPIHELELINKTGYKTIWRINTEKGNITESVTLFYPSGGLCNKREITEYKEYGEGVWLPDKGYYIGYYENGELSRHHKFEVVNAEINVPEMDPELFTMAIPPDANYVYDRDLGISIGPTKDLLQGQDQVTLSILDRLDRMVEERKNAPEEAPTDATEEAIVSPVTTTEEGAGPTGGNTRWIVALVLCLLVLGVLVFRKRLTKGQ